MNKGSILKTFSDLIAIESVSADPKRSGEIIKASDFITRKLASLGFTIKIFQKEKAPALIVARKTVSPKAKTIGIYAHYDVQPEDPLDEWKTSPFKLTAKEGRFWGRGTADDKGHLIANIAAIEQLINREQLNNNITFVFEGEEELGSAHFEGYVTEAKSLLSAIDMFYVTDVGMHGRNKPQIFYGLRGLVYFELAVTIGERDLHSGIYGNQVLNPINVLADLITKIKSQITGEIMIPGFYDDVRKISKKELALLTKVKVSESEAKKEAGVFRVLSVDDTPSYLASKIYPSFDVHGIIGGYTGLGSKTVIPRTASCKFSFRLVEHQDPKDIEQKVRKFIKVNLPGGVKYFLQTLGTFVPFYTDINNEYVRRTAKILSSHFHHETLFNRSGGSIPAAEVFQRIFKKPVILTGFTLPGDNLHAPNENFDEEMFWKGIEALERIYSEI